MPRIHNMREPVDEMTLYIACMFVIGRVFFGGRRWRSTSLYQL